ncbi:MAG: hypothetical protein EXR69_12785 [Myxococcales bacterium]|nr:hypothetical protein [Myxococcales bacterium]
MVELPPERLADVCSFCETPLVRSGGGAEGSDEAFDLVIPFLIPRERASHQLQTFLAGHRWAPEAIRRAARPEKLHGVFVPFYLYDGVARSEYSARVGVDWLRTETYTTRQNGSTVTRRRQVRETEWFDVQGGHVATYTQQLISGSRGLPQGEATQLEPFDLGRALPFAPTLIAGWVAERPNVTHSDASRSVAKQAADLENSVIQNRFVPGDHVRDVRNSTQLSIGAVELALLPVWIATYRLDQQVLRVLVNGQTGEVVGEVPRSPWKIALAVGIVALIVLAALSCLGLLGSLTSLIGRRR